MWSWVSYFTSLSLPVLICKCTSTVVGCPGLPKPGLPAFPIPEWGKRACTGLGDPDSKSHSAVYWLSDLKSSFSELQFRIPEPMQPLSPIAAPWGKQDNPHFPDVETDTQRSSPRHHIAHSLKGRNKYKSNT